ncbi:MAG TPA: hypothetical protein PLM59_09645 [Oscillospiraceae bacterium]|mgnify:CR=1 FL=1|nr:hypothetical protein [Oscillospiraceae bacterium]
MRRRAPRDFEPETVIYDFSKHCPCPCQPLCCPCCCPVPQRDPESCCIAQIKNLIIQLISLFSTQTTISVTVTTKSGAALIGIPAALFSTGTDFGVFTLKNAAGEIIHAIPLGAIAAIYVPTSAGLSSITYLPVPLCPKPCDPCSEAAIRAYLATVPPTSTVNFLIENGIFASGRLYRNEYCLAVITNGTGYPTFVQTCAAEDVTITAPYNG